MFSPKFFLFALRHLAKKSDWIMMRTFPATTARGADFYNVTDLTGGANRTPPSLRRAQASVAGRSPLRKTEGYRASAQDLNLSFRRLYALCIKSAYAACSRFVKGVSPNDVVAQQGARCGFGLLRNRISGARSYGRYFQQPDRARGA
jgi:hypothetical protein